jgi:cytochrome c553
MKDQRVVLVLGLAITCACDTKRTTKESPPVALATATPAATVATAAQSDVERGSYLATIGGCHDCHTPKKMGAKGPEPDPSRLLAGHPAAEKLGAANAAGTWPIAVNGSLTAWSGPWGRSYAANLTPDAETGLGKWTEEQFVEAIRTGKHLGGATSRDILPPMPWPNYAKMTSADLHALFAYLRSIPAVSNSVPAPELPRRM